MPTDIEITFLEWQPHLYLYFEIVCSIYFAFAKIQFTKIIVLMTD